MVVVVVVVTVKRQVAQARFSRLKLINPRTPHHEWQKLSRIRGLKIDREDAQTDLFRMEQLVKTLAPDCVFFFSLKERGVVGRCHMSTKK